MEGDTPTNKAGEQNEQTVIKGFRELLSAVHTLHHISSPDMEIMEHLESVDVNFHRYICVRSM